MATLFGFGQDNYNVQLGRGIIGQPVAYVPANPSAISFVISSLASLLPFIAFDKGVGVVVVDRFEVFGKALIPNDSIVGV